MARHSDKKSQHSVAPVAPKDPSRRSFIERMVSGSVAAPALVTLTGSWLTAEVAGAQAEASQSSGISMSQSESSISGSFSSGSSMSGSASGSSSGIPPVVHATADSTLRQDAPSINEGGNPFVRVSARPIRRGIVQFDPATLFNVRQEMADEGAPSIYLTLHIARNGNDWSQTEDHFVDVHPLPPDYWITEGDGKVSGLPYDQTANDTGNGVTWKVGRYTYVPRPKGAPKRVADTWHGGSDVIGPATASVLHVNGMTGQVSWDVTNDVLTGVNAWIIKVRDERGSDGFPESRPEGFDPFFGSVDYYSKEGALQEIGCAFPPLLQIVPFNSCSGGGESAEGGSAAAIDSPPTPS